MLPIYFVVTSLCWGGSFLAIRIALEHFPPFLAATLRVFIGALSLAFYLLCKFKRLPRPPGWLQMMLSGCLSIGLPWVFLFWGEQYVLPALAAVMNSTVPIFTTLFTPLFVPGMKQGWAKWIGIFIGFLGVTTIFVPELSGGFSVYSMGLVALLMMSICYAIGIHWTKRVSAEAPGAVILFYQCLGGVILLGVATLLFENPSVNLLFSDGTARSWGAILYMGVMSTALAFLLFFHLIRRRGSVEASAVTLCVPLVSVVLDALFLNKYLNPYQLFGAVVILVSVALINRRAERIRSVATRG